jgi:hypothetical protein
MKNVEETRPGQKKSFKFFFWAIHQTFLLNGTQEKDKNDHLMKA